MSEIEQHDETPAPAISHEMAGATTDNPVPIKEKPKVVYFNAVVHEAVQRLHNKGVWYDMGPGFGNLLWRLRPFHHPSVIKVAEATERNVRITYKYDDKEEISGEHRMSINRAAILMATTGLQGYINVGAAQMESEDPEILKSIESCTKALAAAKRWKYEVNDEEGDGLVLIHFDGSETEKKLRDVIEPFLESSVTMLNQLYRASSNLQKIKEEDIFRLGEGYIAGRTVEQDWRD